MMRPSTNWGMVRSHHGEPACRRFGLAGRCEGGGWPAKLAISSWNMPHKSEFVAKRVLVLHSGGLGSPYWLNKAPASGAEGHCVDIAYRQPVLREILVGQRQR